MRLICNIGIHRALPFPRWHDGFYLSNCKRCGAGLVRTTYEGWKVANDPPLPKTEAGARPPSSRGASAFQPGAVAASLALATGTVALAAMGLADRPPSTPPAKQVLGQRVKPKVSAPQTTVRAASSRQVAEVFHKRPAASVMDRKDSPKDARPRKRHLQPLRTRAETEVAEATPPKPTKAKIKYRYSANMRLFCQRAGKHTPECRVFRQRTASKQL